MLQKKGQLFVVSGPSGAGKGTILKEVYKKRKDIYFSISATTRSPRVNEKEGKSYYFLDEEEFKRRIDSDDFLEWAEVYGNYYGTLKGPVIHQLERGLNVLLEIDIQGALQIKEMYEEAVFIFVLPPSLKVLKQRIIDRGSETDETLNRRMKKALEEISYIEKYDYFIINGELEESVKTMESILNAENAKVARDIVEMLETEQSEFTL